MHLLIKNGVFNIVNRLKKIDKNYYIIFNTSTQNIEIHNKKQKNTFCLSCPNNVITGRVIKEIHKSSIKNLSYLIDEITLNNEQIELNSLKQKNDYIKFQALSLMDYLSNSSKGANLFHF